MGVNDRRVAVSCGNWESRFRRETPGLLGPELVRLTLERSHSAGHALTVLTDLIARHGQGTFIGNPVSEGEGEGEGEGGDHSFLIGDPDEAYAVEAAGCGWAAQEVHQVRAAGDVGMIRQDWYRLAPGLSDNAITHGWWAEDGSKLDFVGGFERVTHRQVVGAERWGRATMLLEQQNGHLDVGLLPPDPGRPLRRHPLRSRPPGRPRTCNAALPARLASDRRSHRGERSDRDPHIRVNQPTVFWAAFGPPCIGVHFPLVMEGELPSAIADEPADMWNVTSN